MTTKFRFADWNPKRGTIPCYAQDPSTGQITVGEVLIGADGQPVDACGLPLLDDGETVQLRGWAHTQAASYNNGRLLLPLKGSLA